MDDVSPDLFLDAVLGYLKTAAIRGAVALDLFTAIGAGADTAEALAARTGAQPRGVAILCDYLAVHGFLTKAGGRYGLTPSTRAFLDRRSPACMGAVVEFLAAPRMTALFLDDPASYVRNGGAEGLANLAPDNPLWVTFAEAMVPFMAPVAQAVAQTVAAWPVPPQRVLDIAAGHGLFGIALARLLPEAEITAVDWGGVLAVARRNAEQAGIAGRYRTLAGSAFDLDWGGGYDLVMLPNFLHHFDAETCAGLLGKARRAAAPAGRTLAVEFVPAEDRVSPPLPAMFSFMMLGSTPKGQAFTAGELDALARAGGYRGATVSPLPPTPQSLVLFEG